MRVPLASEGGLESHEVSEGFLEPSCYMVLFAMIKEYREVGMESHGKNTFLKHCLDKEIPLAKVACRASKY